MARQGQAAIVVAGSCKAWLLSDPVFEFEITQDQSVPPELAQAQQRLQEPHPRGANLVQSIDLLAQALNGRPRNRALLGAVMQCAEELSAGSIKQAQEFKKLERARAIFAQRQQWVDYCVGSTPADDAVYWARRKHQRRTEGALSPIFPTEHSPGA